MYTNKNATNIKDDGETSSLGYKVDNSELYVRPVMWIKIGA